MIYLGYANGWVEEPDLYKEAKERGLDIIPERIGNCLVKYTCPELGFYYYIDSSD